MSLNGTGMPTPRPSEMAICSAKATHWPPPLAFTKLASDVFRPDLRKKLSSAGVTYGPCGPMPHGFTPDAVATVSGLEVALAVPGCAVPAFTAATALRQFAVSSAGFTGFTLMGRFRWRPPVELKATLSERLWPKSCSTPKEICCTYGVL